MGQEELNISFIAIIGMAFSLVIAVFIVLLYVRYQQRIQRQKKSMHEAELAHQKNLLYAIIQSQDKERKRIGQDLHDDVGAGLSRLRMLMQKKPTVIAATATNHSMESQDCTTLIDKIILDVRDISHNLSPPALELFGFAEALEELCESFSKTTGLEISLKNNTPGFLDKIQEDTALQLYRVFQELLNNTVKHANASKAAIDFSDDNNKLKIVYCDNGCGLAAVESKKPGIGLQNIESRLGLLGAVHKIKSAPGEGFSITICLDNPVIIKQ